MPRVLTNNTSLAYAVEASTGVLPGSPVWKLLEPNSINSFGANISTVARSPISNERQRRKGTITDLDSAVEFEADLTIEQLRDFAEAFIFASAVGPVSIRSESNSTLAAGSGAYTHAAIAAAIPANRLVYARGFPSPGNNGLKVVGSGSTTTNTVVSGVTAESVAARRNASLEVAGVRGASGDLQIDGNGDLTSTALNMTTLGLTVGQFIHVGGLTAANQFANAANLGMARVMGIAAGKLTLDKKLTTFVTDSGAGKQIDILFGQFIRNVGTDHADFLERSIQFEGAFPNLGSGGAEEYEYPEGNFANEMSFNMPLTDKATVSVGFVGTDTPEPTGTRKTNAANAYNPERTGAFNTSADFIRLVVAQTDETGITTDFKSATVSINNNVSPEKVLNKLGAKFMNFGNFEIAIEAQLVFTSSAVVSAIRNNETLSLSFGLRNDDGGFMVDVPSCTMGGGGKDFPVNESVLINTTLESFGDATLGTSLSLSLFPVLP